MFKRTLLVGLVTTILSGCMANTNTQVPLAKTYPYTEQQKMQAAQHWDVLAEDVATRLKEHFSTSSITGRSISIIPNASTPFEAAFEDMLTSQMVNQGLDVSANDRGQLKLSFDTQVVSHSDRGYIRPKTGTYTAFSLIATGVWAAINIAENSTAVADTLIGGSLIGAGVGMDHYAGDITDISNKEVIINVSLMDDDRYLVRKTGIYYINEPDESHYYAKPEQSKVVATKRTSLVSE